MRRLRGVRGVVHAVGVVVVGGVVVAGSFGVDPGDARQLFERGVSAQRGAEARGDASVRAEHAVAKGSHRAARQGGGVGGDVAEDVAEEDFLRERRSGEGGVANLEEGERESHEEVAGGEREGVRLGPDSGGIPVGVRARVVGALTGRVRQLGEGREREVEVAKYLPRERATPRGHGREEREGAVVPDAYPAREVRVDRAHAALEHRARQAVELEVDESLRRGRVRGQATQHVREEAQQGDAHLLRVVQMVRVPQRQDVREPGGHLEVRLRESGRRETARGGRSVKIGVREVRARERGGGGSARDVISRECVGGGGGRECRVSNLHDPLRALGGSAKLLAYRRQRRSHHLRVVRIVAQPRHVRAEGALAVRPRGGRRPLTHRARGTTTSDALAGRIYRSVTRANFAQPTRKNHRRRESRQP